MMFIVDESEACQGHISFVKADMRDLVWVSICDGSVVYEGCKTHMSMHCMWGQEVGVESGVNIEVLAWIPLDVEQ